MKTTLLIILAIISFQAFSQNIIIDDSEKELSNIERDKLREKRLNAITDKIGVSISVPFEFTLVNKTIEAPENGTSVDYAFVNKDSSIFITVGLMPRDSIDYEKSRVSFKLFMPSIKNYEPNDQWVFNLKGTVDSSKYKPQFFDSNILKKFNAEGGVEYKSKVSTELYLGKYLRERSIILNKKFRGIIEMHFFKLPKAKNEVSGIVKKAYEIIKYN